MRKRCQNKNSECFREPKFKSFKTFHISPALDVRKFGGIVMHEIHTKKFMKGIVIDMKEDGLDEECLKREHFG